MTKAEAVEGPAVFYDIMREAANGQIVYYAEQISEGDTAGPPNPR
jgi:hypothetical protein